MESMLLSLEEAILLEDQYRCSPVLNQWEMQQLLYVIAEPLI